MSERKFRDYSKINEQIRNNYKKNRINQTSDYVLRMKKEFVKRKKVKMHLWEIVDKLSKFIDISDPDINLPNSFHLFQAAEKARLDNKPDWFQLVCLLHDIGKIMYLWGKDKNGMTIKEQWGIVGDTFITGCVIPPKIIFPEFNKFNRENDFYLEKKQYNGKYENNCGLNNCLVSWGHDEFLFMVLKNNKNTIPQEGLYIIRYHSLYLWHDKNEYKMFENEIDTKMKPWVQQFNKYDLYTKNNNEFNINELKEYYLKIFFKYFNSEYLVV